MNLQPKSVAVLQYLLEHPHRLVTKEELIASVWPDSRVVVAALKVRILEIRKALGDQASKPKFIETVGTKGLPIHRADQCSITGQAW